jgi:uncharacterized damage-inducible protein DinB
LNLNEHFRAMARNNAWFNARLHGACAQLSEDEFAAERTSFFPSLQLTLNHILVVDRAYLADLNGTGRSPSKIEVPFPRAADVATAQKQTDLELVTFCDRLGADALDRVVGTGPFSSAVAAWA